MAMMMMSCDYDDEFGNFGGDENYEGATGDESYDF